MNFKVKPSVEPFTNNTIPQNYDNKDLRFLLARRLCTLTAIYFGGNFFPFLFIAINHIILCDISTEKGDSTVKRCMASNLIGYICLNHIPTFLNLNVTVEQKCVECIRFVMLYNCENKSHDGKRKPI